jgi:RNA polymerase sigma-70 factor, ECF subfamily
VGLAAKGDSSALEQLLFDQYEPLEQYLRPRIPTGLRAVLAVEDLLQQTFMDAFRGIRSFEERGLNSFSGWLRTIAEHRLQDTLKTLRRKKRGGNRRAASPTMTSSGTFIHFVDMLLDEARTPARSVARREALQGVQIKLAGLPEDQRQSLIYHYLEGRSIEETAMAMQRTVGAVRGLLHRGKEALRAACGSASLWLSQN